MSKPIHILHLTDLHLNNDVIEDFELMLKNPLIKDIKQRISNDTIDFVFITGDIIDKGGVDLGGTYEGLTIAKEKVIDIIAIELNLDKETIFIVPGNHDITRNSDSSGAEKGMKGRFKNHCDIKDYIKEVNDGECHGVKRLSEYRRFEKEFYSHYLCKETDTFFNSTFIKKTKGVQFGISCLNSSWRCYSDDDKGHLLIGENEILKSKQLIEKCDVKIALLHHHTEYLSDIEKSDLEQILLKYYDIVFFGHSHDNNDYAIKKGGSECIWIGSPSAFYNARTDSRKYSSGYSICSLNKTHTEMQYAYFSNTNKDYRLHTDIGDNGFDQFPSILPKAISKTEKTTIDIIPKNLVINEAPITIIDNKLQRITKPTNLFTGRLDKLKALEASFNQNDIISITGIGGIGKTQLVLKFLDQLLILKKQAISWQDFIESSYFDNFIVASGFGVIVQNNNTEIEKFSALVDKLNEHHRIIVWDNFHDNNDPTFMRFLNFSIGKLNKTKIIIISRTQHSTKFKNIPLTDFKEGITYAQCLLKERHPRLHLTSSDLSKLCEYVNGHPLAIELSLHLCESISLEKVIGKLTKHTSGIDTLSQRLFEDILELDTTSPEEKKFLYEFSVFKEKVSEETIEAIFGEKCFYNEVPSLTKKYVLEFNDGYYHTHPLIRDFCYSKINDKISLHTKVADWFKNQRTDTLNLLLEDRIFHHLKGAKDIEKILCNIEQLGREFITHAFFEPLLEMISFVRKNNPNPQTLLDFLEGDIHRAKGDWDVALHYFEKAQSNYLEEELALESLLYTADIYREKGKNSIALSIFKEGEILATQKDFKKFIAWAHNGIATIKMVYGQYNEAFKLFQSAIKISTQLNIKSDIATLYNNIGALYKIEGFKHYSLQNSLDFYNKGLKISLEDNNRNATAYSFNNLGGIYSNKNLDSYNLDTALEYLNKSLAIRLEIGAKLGIASCYNNIGYYYSISGSPKYNLKIAQEYFERSIDLSVEIGDKYGVSTSYTNIGNLFNNEKALEFYYKALKYRLEIGDKMGLADSYYSIGYTYYKQQLYKQSISYNLKAYAIYKQLNSAVGKNNTSICINSIKRDFGIKALKMQLELTYKEIAPELQQENILSELLNEPIKSTKQFGRNDSVSVVYNDGNIIQKKYKKVEKDIAQGLCSIVNQ